MKSFEALEKYEITLNLFRILKQYYKIDRLLQCFLKEGTVVTNRASEGEGGLEVV